MDLFYWLIPLLLAIPLGISANILTPWIKNKYALSSQKRLKQRIDWLEKELVRISSPSEHLLNGLWLVLKFLTFIAVNLVFSALGILFPTRAEPFAFFSLLLSIIAIPTLIIFSILLYSETTAKYKTKLENDIARLKAKLQKYTSNNEVLKDKSH